MDVVELFKGVAVVIDDEVDDDKANIQNILVQIKKQNIPLLTYSAIPFEDASHFQNLSFVLLDWRLIKQEISSEDFEEGITLPPTLQRYEAQENIDFIKKLKEFCFCPIFIFTNEGQEVVIDKLESEGLYSKDKPNHIFIKSKNDLKGKAKLFSEIEKWLKNNPSVYVLKEWEREYQKSKNKLFTDFQELSSVWPKVMWKNFEDDGANKSFELGELISRNLHTRMTPFEFDNDILGKRGKKIEKSELKRVLEGERFLKNENLHQDDISPGDIFKISSNYYVNIRAACDLIPDRLANNSSCEIVQLYLLKGTKLSDGKARSTFNKKYGLFPEIDSQSIIFPLHEGNAIVFRFKNLEIKTWAEIKNKRIGRILPPYINRIQQRYALYLQRQGLPRTPSKAVF
jgi:hypothetical protein